MYWLLYHTTSTHGQDTSWTILLGMCKLLHWLFGAFCQVLFKTNLVCADCTSCFKELQLHSPRRPSHVCVFLSVNPISWAAPLAHEAQAAEPASQADEPVGSADVELVRKRKAEGEANANNHVSDGPETKLEDAQNGDATTTAWKAAVWRTQCSASMISSTLYIPNPLYAGAGFFCNASPWRPYMCTKSRTFEVDPKFDDLGQQVDWMLCRRSTVEPFRIMYVSTTCLCRRPCHVRLDALYFPLCKIQRCGRELLCCAVCRSRLFYVLSIETWQL